MNSNENKNKKNTDPQDERSKNPSHPQASPEAGAAAAGAIAGAVAGAAMSGFGDLFSQSGGEAPVQPPPETPSSSAPLEHGVAASVAGAFVQAAQDNISPAKPTSGSASSGSGTSEIHNPEPEVFVGTENSPPLTENAPPLTENELSGSVSVPSSLNSCSAPGSGPQTENAEVQFSGYRLELDSNQDGRVDEVVWDINQDSFVDVLGTDTNADGRITQNEIDIIHDPATLQNPEEPADPSLLFVDVNQDQTPELMIMDTNADSRVDLVIQNPQEDITYSGEVDANIPEDVDPSQEEKFKNDLTSLDDPFSDLSNWTSQT
ncbi:MAG: hypothetical protein NZM15_09670 [Flavobacteriales bacterium]|nr:hypothetical protein [Flavobacteriales bacterium]MDW8432951.1 hypothetical protein [Flavobacteriales bacterium]